MEVQYIPDSFYPFGVLFKLQSNFHQSMTGITSWNSDDEVKKPLSNQTSIESLRVEEKNITISQDLTWCKPLLTTLYFVGPPPQCEMFKCFPKRICISLRNIAKDSLVEQHTPWLWKHGSWKQYPFQWALSLSPKTHIETLVMFWWTMCVFSNNKGIKI